MGVHFFQVGRDEGAVKEFEALNDGLVRVAGDRNVRDIVDTVPFAGTHLTGDGILEVVLGAVNRRLGRENSKGLRG